MSPVRERHEGGLLVKAVFFDLEGTLTHTRSTPASRDGACRRIGNFLGANGVVIDGETVKGVIREGMDSFEAWKAAHLREIPPAHLWPDIIFKAFDQGLRDGIRRNADGISLLWEEHAVQRRIRRGALGVLRSLRDAGLTLGLVSNVLHAGRTRRYLEEKGFAEVLSVVILSQEVGYRKPHPVIFQEAARLAGVHPSQTVFVGDTLSRDILGAQKAGFGHTIFLPSEMSPLKDKGMTSVTPDFTVQELSDLPHLIESLSRQGRLFGAPPPAR
jgi:putative hydrolase of the HAD superfamily